MKSVIIKILHNLKIPGFYGLSIYDVGLFFLEGIIKGAITTRASSLAFNFFLAFFPSIIVIFTLIPYIPIKGFHETLMNVLLEILPPTDNQAILNTLNDIINNPRGGLLSITFVLTLYFSTNGIHSLIEAFNASYHVNENRSILKQRALSLFLTLLLSLILIVTIGLIIFGKISIDYLINQNIIIQNTGQYILFAKWLIITTMLLVGISILFHLAPSIKNKWKLFTPGSLFATIFIIITSLGFNFYIENFSQYNKIYGSIGTLMIILFWMYFNSIILLTGFELNASILNANQKDILK